MAKPSRARKRIPTAGFGGMRFEQKTGSPAFGNQPQHPLYEAKKIPDQQPHPSLEQRLKRR